LRAVVFVSPEEPVEVWEVDLQPPGPGEVLVQIVAAGVCHSDLHLLRGEWIVPTPFVLGHEGSGVVVQVGADVTELSEGDHVVLSWVAPCGACRHCRSGHEARCEVAATVVGPGGVLSDGTSRLSRHGQTVFHQLGVSSYAEFAVVPASGAIPVSKDAPLDTLALLGCAVTTGVGAVMNTAKVHRGSTVAVVGCGGVGLSVVQGARLAGADRIIAIDVRPEKAALALTLGATEAIDVSEVAADIALRELIPGGVDYAFDAIGKVTTTEQVIRMLGIGGSAVLVGLPPSGARASFEPLELAGADQRILGSNYGGIQPSRDIPWLVDRFRAGELLLEPLVSARRELEAASDALEELESGRALRTLLLPGA